ncbi:hypothetical protein CYMTET_9467 [Cymbomonas tetramitiformis]|uniref:Uncharacterized protein n=1 Tax=Cymbomonas tetramitiformis TaxID=36881 RepID=A0AAE0GRK4_9CHLO|nr:hypothetical protein CYMTET_9467 [Cymbomonas tetramitiformis]
MVGDVLTVPKMGSEGMTGRRMVGDVPLTVPKMGVKDGGGCADGAKMGVKGRVVGDVLTVPKMGVKGAGLHTADEAQMGSEV